MTTPHFRPTLADVASAAGVSRATVSRVIEGSDQVAPATRERVLSEMKRLGYFGNAAASQLVSGKTQTICVLASSISEFGYVRTIEGIEKEAREQGYSLMIRTLDRQATDDAEQIVASVASQALSGIVVLDYDFVAGAVLAQLPGYIPVVSCGHPEASTDHGHPTVFIEDSEASELVAAHLVELGHRSIFVIDPPNYTYARSQRTSGVASVLAEHNLPMFPPVVAESWRSESGYRAAQELLARHGNVITAIACSNDELALGAISAISNAGLQVPGDISITGIDDNPIAQCAVPPITTVRQDFELLGRTAFKTLLAVLSGDVVQPTRITGLELIARRSTGAPNPARGWTANR